MPKTVYNRKKSLLTLAVRSEITKTFMKLRLVDVKNMYYGKKGWGYI